MSTERGSGRSPSGIVPIVILNWNGERDTIECLRSIRASVPAGFVPMVVDNASAPDSVTQLKIDCQAIYPHMLAIEMEELLAPTTPVESFQPYLNEDSLLFVECPENLGFARGSNLGVRLAERTGGSWVMLLNNDTVVLPETLVELRRFMEANPAIRVVTAQIRHFEPSTRVQNCGGDLTYFGSRRYRLENADASMVPDTEYSLVSFLTGCAMLYNFRELGSLTEDFFFGEEDYEFALRMQQAGQPMACVHRAVVRHKGGATIKRSSRLYGSIVGHYVARLLNTRNYYSRVRWYATKMLAYLYLPILLSRSGIGPGKALSGIRRIETYLRHNRTIDRAQFQAMIANER